MEKTENTKKITKEEAKAFLNERLESFSLMNDYFFSAFMKENHACMQVSLRAFTGDDTICVTDVRTQYPIENLRPHRDRKTKGRGIRLDSFVATQQGKFYDLEVENRGENLELRIRYYSSLTDTNLLNRGEDFSTLKDLTTIFVMPRDIRGKGKPTYIVRRAFVEAPDKVGKDAEIYEDGSMYIFVNGKYEERDTLIGRVIHDFMTPLSEPKLVKEFQEEMECIILDANKRERMVDTMIAESMMNIDLQNLLSDAEREKKREEGRMEGRMEGIKDFAKYLVASGVIPSNKMSDIMNAMKQGKLLQE